MAKLMIDWTGTKQARSISNISDPDKRLKELEKARRVRREDSLTGPRGGKYNLKMRKDGTFYRQYF